MVTFELLPLEHHRFVRVILGAVREEPDVDVVGARVIPVPQHLTQRLEHADECVVAWRRGSGTIERRSFNFFQNDTKAKHHIHIGLEC